MSGILLDTHVWIWYVNGNHEISNTIRKKINAALQNNEAHLAAISLWEIGMLDARKRIILGMPCLEWINQSIELTHIRIINFTPSIAVESCHLPGTFHNDPADRMIVASARVEGCVVLTRDSKILEYSQSQYVSALEV